MGTGEGHGPNDPDTTPHTPLHTASTRPQGPQATAAGQLSFLTTTRGHRPEATATVYVALPPTPAPWDCREQSTLQTTRAWGFRLNFKRTI